MNTLQNTKCSLSFRGLDEKRPWISGNDLTDKYNDTKFFTRNVRGIKKGWAELEKQFNQDTTMWRAIDILEQFKLNCHSYCGMD